ncbi:SDR family NAD(P)-dependent oxidoreductase [Nesterenkonia muleiensis]|uniref:SDR family NAD(P)-dependent oxidoreductase n=1 Tax=Nesterenkonia muleiensis TaxID=2282648 RepID=UPI000E74A82D|nr:SDR family oxidoreductase [Nesterenkonia muleiensis]
MSEYTTIFSLQGRRAIVTGASRGIGRSIALAIASAGAKVALTARGAEHLSETCSWIAKEGGHAEVVPADLSDHRRVPELADRAEEALGGLIDIVVHCAGAQHREAAVGFPFEEWERVIQVNLTAPFVLSQEVGRRQIAAGLPGNHVFVCSLTSVLGLPNLVAYNAAKSGLMGVVRALSREWSQHDIRVNGISPGYVETEMTKELLADPVRRQKLLDRIPANRFGTTEELGAPTVFLASEGSAYMTGQLLIVDGGWQGA